FFFSSRRRHTRFSRDWSSDVCSSDLADGAAAAVPRAARPAHDGALRTPNGTGGACAPPATDHVDHRAASAAQCLRYSALAAATTASTVMPKCLYSSPAGALAPKVSMPITAPSRPTYWRQKPVTPASTATRLRTAPGSTDSR